MSEKNLIFVGGIHGVGKTTYCKKLSEKLNLPHYSCSQLISTFKKLDSKNKLTSKIDENQNFLKLAIDKYIPYNSSYILDGHFCLINDKYEIKEIPEETFKNLGITKILLLINSPSNIIRNLKNRDKKDYSEDLVNKFQDKEISYSKIIAKSLNIDIQIIKLSDFN